MNFEIIQMDDDSCTFKYIEIVPLDNSAQQFEDSKPFEVKVWSVNYLAACITDYSSKHALFAGTNLICALVNAVL